MNHETNGVVRTFFTSDLHFFHKNICKFTDRQWTQEENEEKLIELWNNQVAPGDVVWHLGDFFFLKRQESEIQKALEIVNRLNGQINCILGNHDSSKFFGALKSRTNKIVSVERLKELIITGDKGDKRHVTLCHYPLMSWNRSHYGTYHLFGHHHGSIHHPGRAVDVGLDGSLERLGMHRFWTSQDVIDYLEERPIFKPDGDHHTPKRG